MAELFWTKKLPTEDGWYWWRKSINWHGHVVRVYCGIVDQVLWPGRYKVDVIGGEWYGPLVEPGGDAIENCHADPRLLDGGTGG